MVYQNKKERREEESGTRLNAHGLRLIRRLLDETMKNNKVICKKCGTEMEVPANAKFCGNCGTPFEEPQKHVEAPKKGRKVNGRAVVVAILLVICVLGVVAGCIGAMSKPVIDLNKYMIIEVSGQDGYGYARATFDRESFDKDYKNIIKYTTKDEDTLLQMRLIYATPRSAFRDNCVWGSLSERDHLSNGDTITYTWTCDDELAAEVFGVKLKYSDITVVVTGLGQ